MVTETYTEDDLDKWTNRYWKMVADGRMLAEGNYDACWDYYLGKRGEGFAQAVDEPPGPLLDLELEWGRQRPDHLPTPRPKTTLALLVGTSFEPLLQSIRAYQPDRLVPVVNCFYGDRENSRNNRIAGKTKWSDLRRLVERLGIRGLQMPEESALRTVEDTPTDVFDHLREQLRGDLADTDRHVIIDITGAKKTMVAGAYLLGAYSRATISYVDFDRWDEGEGKPYGYSCKIDAVDNPLRRWALREWDRVKEQYNKRNFAAAQDVISKIEVPGYEERVSHLRNYFEVCDAWENGDLTLAKEKAGSLPEELSHTLPTAIDKLEAFWPAAGTPAAAMLSKQFFLDPWAVMTYAHDELSRAKRLSSRTEMRPDYRGAFARAYAVYETLIKARAVLLFHKGDWQCNVQGDSYWSDQMPANYTDGVLSWMLYRMQTDHAKRLLGTPRKATMPQKFAYRDNSGATVKVTIDPTHSTRKVVVPRGLTEEGEKRLRDYRNLITHTYIPVEKTLVDEAISQAEAYVDEYCTNWGVVADPNFTPTTSFDASVFDVPSWEALTDRCGLNFLI